MSSTDTEGRIKTLLHRADEAIKTDELHKAAEALREASHLDADSAGVKERWTTLQKKESGADVPELIKVYLGGQEDADGEKALRALKAKQLPKEEAARVAELLLNITSNPELLDALTGALLSRNIDARRVATRRLIENATGTFEQLFDRVTVATR